MIIQNLSKTYWRKPALEPVNWKIGKGVYGLLGPSGAGKSTLLKILSGTLRPSGGDVMIDDLNLSSHPDEYQQSIGYLSESFAVDGELTILDVLITCAVFKGLHRAKRKQEIQKALQKLDLWDSRNLTLKSCSIGTQQRLGIAASFLAHPKVLLLDEPLRGLSPAEKALVSRLLCDYGHLHTVIFSSRKPTHLFGVSRDVIVLKDGHILFQGAPKAIVDGRHDTWGIHPQMKLSASVIKSNHSSKSLIEGYRRIVGGWHDE